MNEARAYSAAAKTSPLGLSSIQRRDLTPADVRIQILYCGVCHSDLHQVRDEWGGTIYPCVPGHEIVGRITAIGSAVTKFKVGDLGAVGCMVDSCRTCPDCQEHLEQYCQHFPTFTYNSPDKHTGGVTYGGYSESIVVDEAFTLKVPTNLNLAAVAPLLCAGITTYSPLRHWNAGPGKKVGIVGLGGLGHMGVKFAHAFGAHVVLFTTSPDKKDDALRLGADEVVVSKNADEMNAHARSFDFILDAVSADHDINAYTALLKRDATLTWWERLKNLSVSASSTSCSVVAPSPVPPSAASRKPRKCSIFAVPTTSLPTSRSSPFRRSTKRTSACSRAM